MRTTFGDFPIGSSGTEERTGFEVGVGGVDDRVAGRGGGRGSEGQEGEGEEGERGEESHRGMRWDVFGWVVSEDVKVRRGGEC